MFIHNNPKGMIAHNFDNYSKRFNLDFCFSLNNRNTKRGWGDTITFYRIMVKD